MLKKLSIGAIIVLVFGLMAVPGFAAETLYEDAFDGTTFGYEGKSDGYGKSDFGTAFWFPNNGFLESGLSDAIQERFLWLTGDPAWSDVSVSAGWKKIGGQGSGAASLFLRASDKDTFYEFRLQNGNVSNQDAESAAGIHRAEGATFYRILKWVDGVPTLLAEISNNDLWTLPANQNGTFYVDQILEFRFTAKGSILSVDVKINPEHHKLLSAIPGMTSFGADASGGRWVRVLTAQDRELTEGRVGLGHYENEIVYDYIKVETVD